jgi:hypothetical protein
LEQQAPSGPKPGGVFYSSRHLIIELAPGEMPEAKQRKTVKQFFIPHPHAADFLFLPFPAALN